MVKLDNKIPDKAYQFFVATVGDSARLTNNRWNQEKNSTFGKEEGVAFC